MKIINLEIKATYDTGQEDSFDFTKVQAEQVVKQIKAINERLTKPLGKIFSKRLGGARKGKNRFVKMKK